MALKFVVGLFETKGIAEDACNRLRHEGVPTAHISLLLLHDRPGIPTAMTPEVEAMSVDPLVVGDVHKSFAELVRNGETAVFVRAHDEAEVDLAVDTIRQYAPMRIKVVAAEEGMPVGHDIL